MRRPRRTSLPTHPIRKIDRTSEGVGARLLSIFAIAALTLPSLSTSLAVRARPMGRLDGAEVLEGAG